MARLLLLTLALAAAPARAQLAAGMGVSPEDALLPDERPSTGPVHTPLALALALAFSSTTWESVGVSTTATDEAMAELLSRGYYRLEIIELTLMAQRSGKRLLDLRKRRVKDRRSLRQLAEEAKQPWDALSDQAEAIGAEVDARAEDLTRVGPAPVPPAPAPPGGSP